MEPSFTTVQPSSVASTWSFRVSAGLTSGERKTVIIPRLYSLPLLSMDFESTLQWRLQRFHEEAGPYDLVGSDGDLLMVVLLEDKSIAGGLFLQMVRQGLMDKLNAIVVRDL